MDTLHFVCKFPRSPGLKDVTVRLDVLTIRLVQSIYQVPRRVLSLRADPKTEPATAPGDAGELRRILIKISNTLF